MGAVRFDQYYVFTGPGGKVWCEIFLADDGTHIAMPTQHRFCETAVSELKRLHPGATVGVLTHVGELQAVAEFVVKDGGETDAKRDKQ